MVAFLWKGGSQVEEKKKLESMMEHLKKHDEAFDKKMKELDEKTEKLKKQLFKEKKDDV